MFTFSKGRLSLGYVLFQYTPMVSALNELVQKSVEYGFYKFYKDMEYNLKQLDSRSLVDESDYNVRSQTIEMDHIWLYVYGFVIVNCCNFIVFLVEILIFHRGQFKYFFRYSVRKQTNVNSNI